MLSVIKIFQRITDKKDAKFCCSKERKAMRKYTPDYIVELSREFRRNQTTAESELWKRLRSNSLSGIKFRRQYAIGRYIADFYCSKANLVIEIDGKIHETIDKKEYDLIRESEIRARNIRILRFTNEQIMNDIKVVLCKIKDEII
jgi:very-short-patch-repair endonuclease